MTTSQPSQLSPPDPYVRFALDEQAVGALQFLAELLPRTMTNPYLWKWVVAATHDALHGFMGLALRRTDGAQLLDSKSEQQTYTRWEQERELGGLLPEEERRRVDVFINLFEKIQEEQRMQQYGHSLVFAPTRDQEKSVRSLNQRRNKLTHYSDVTLLVPVVGILRDVADCVDVIDWLLTRSNNVMIREQASENAAKQAIGEINDELKRLAEKWPKPCDS